MADGDVPVALVGVADARSLEEEQVVCRAVVCDPEVPQPVIRKAEHCSSLDGARGHATDEVALQRDEDEQRYGHAHERSRSEPVSYTHLRAHETVLDLV